MLITNSNNLPVAFMRAIQDGIRVPVDGEYSVTELLKPIQEIVLTRQNFNRIEQDASEYVNLIIGTAVHDYLAKFDGSGESEIRLRADIIAGYTLTGQYDLYDAETCSLVDYKTASVYKVLMADYDDYRKQGLMYAWLLARIGKHVERLQFHILLKDWSASDLERRTSYPATPLVTWEYHVTVSDMQEIEQYIRERIAVLAAGTVPPCTEAERWNSGDRFAAMGKSRAIKICDTYAEAAALSQTVEVRRGIDRKCSRYCQARDFCKQYQASLLSEREE